jgi:hypothetical protein
MELYYSTFLGLAQIILFSFLLNFSQKKTKRQNFQKLNKVAKFELMINSTK